MPYTLDTYPDESPGHPAFTVADVEAQDWLVRVCLARWLEAIPALAHFAPALRALPPLLTDEAQRAAIPLMQAVADASERRAPAVQYPPEVGGWEAVMLGRRGAEEDHKAAERAVRLTVGACMAATVEPVARWESHAGGLDPARDGLHRVITAAVRDGVVVTPVLADIHAQLDGAIAHLAAL